MEGDGYSILEDIIFLKKRELTNMEIEIKEYYSMKDRVRQDQHISKEKLSIVE